MKNPTIIPKIAYVEYNESIDEFFEEWAGDNDEPPTQEDYDEWLIEQFWALLCCGDIYKEDIKFGKKSEELL